MANYQRKTEPVEAWRLSTRAVPDWVFAAALEQRIQQGPPASHPGWMNRGLIVVDGDYRSRHLGVLDWIVLTADGSLLGVGKDEFVRRYEALAEVATPE